jgi:hypothetical protein
MASLWADELVRQTWVIAFTVILRDQVLNGGSATIPRRRRSPDPGRTPGCCAQISPRRRSGLETALVASRTAAAISSNKSAVNHGSRS